MEAPSSRCYEGPVDTKHLGSTLLALGILVALIGAGLRLGLLSWFGKLPGDLRFESESTRVFVPLTSMLLVSIALSLLAWIWRRAS